ncbi:MAG TPA: hypothetical protein VKE96_15600 [Vicinamibacterales bacterium]|nr:hypothetical protein [Vicinamibacterales bacterium]
MYIYSLTPPRNPHPRDARAQTGEPSMANGVLLVAHFPMFELTTAATVTAATACLMWLSDDLTRRGVGNRLLITFIGGAIAGLTDVRAAVQQHPLALALRLLVATAVVAFVARGYRDAILIDQADMQRMTHSPVDT